MYAMDASISGEATGRHPVSVADFDSDKDRFDKAASYGMTQCDRRAQIAETPPKPSISMATLRRTSIDPAGTQAHLASVKRPWR